jgi:hypothetical protein
LITKNKSDTESQSQRLGSSRGVRWRTRDCGDRKINRSTAARRRITLRFAT